jgi:hypothetical protein
MMHPLSIVIVKKANIMVTVHFTSELQDKAKKCHKATKTRFSTTEYKHLSRIQSCIMIKAIHTPCLVSIGESKLELSRRN